MARLSPGAALLVAQAVAWMGFASVLPLYVHAQGVPLVWLRWLVAAYGLAGLAAQLLQGRWSDRIGRRQVLMGGLRLAALGTRTFSGHWAATSYVACGGRCGNLAPGRPWRRCRTSFPPTVRGGRAGRWWPPRWPVWPRSTRPVHTGDQSGNDGHVRRGRPADGAAALLAAGRLPRGGHVGLGPASLKPKGVAAGLVTLGGLSGRPVRLGSTMPPGAFVCTIPGRPGWRLGCHGRSSRSRTCS